MHRFEDPSNLMKLLIICFKNPKSTQARFLLLFVISDNGCALYNMQREAGFADVATVGDKGRKTLVLASFT